MALCVIITLPHQFAATTAATTPLTVEQWGVYEISQQGPADFPSFNAFVEVTYNATFTDVAGGGGPITVPGFYDELGTYKVRFSPPRTGAWNFTTSSNTPTLPSLSGGFNCTSPALNNHGPVITDPSNPRVFVYAGDGSLHFSVGSTSYAWAHVNDDNAAATLASLRGGPFNKLRMTVFPKYYPYTHMEPPDFAYAHAGAPPAPCFECCPSYNATFDLTRFHAPFWQRFEGYVATMSSMGIEADIILFHPYDGGHWGFDCMGPVADEAYLRYAAARLSAYRNVWWSMANEWSNLLCKGPGGSQTYWDTLFRILHSADVHGRRTSIHNNAIYYNHSQPWITHISMQCRNASCVDMARENWTAKPVVMDEVRYEGNITATWGQLSAESMTQRFWMFLAKGAYCGHSECMLPSNWTDACANQNACTCSPNMWWNHGGSLVGHSSPAIAWFRDFVESLPVVFNKLISDEVQTGVYWLHDASTTYNIVLWDEIVNSLPVPATIPLSALAAGYRARQIDFMNSRLIDMGTRPPGPLVMTPPTPGFMLELTTMKAER